MDDVAGVMNRRRVRRLVTERPPSGFAAKEQCGVSPGARDIPCFISDRGKRRHRIIGKYVGSDDQGMVRCRASRSRRADGGICAARVNHRKIIEEKTPSFRVIKRIERNTAELSLRDDVYNGYIREKRANRRNDEPPQFSRAVATRLAKAVCGCGDLLYVTGEENRTGATIADDQSHYAARRDHVFDDSRVAGKGRTYASERQRSNDGSSALSQIERCGDVSAPQLERDRIAPNGVAPDIERGPFVHIRNVVSPRVGQGERASKIRAVGGVITECLIRAAALEIEARQMCAFATRLELTDCTVEVCDRVLR